MAETLRELVVALSLDSSNFSRNMITTLNGGVHRYGRVQEVWQAFG